MHVSVLEFFIENTKSDEFEGKRVIEVGSKYANGSVRPLIEKFLKPKVSVVIPTYNRADLLPRAISSVLNQRIIKREEIIHLTLARFNFFDKKT